MTAAPHAVSGLFLAQMLTENAIDFRLCFLAALSYFDVPCSRPYFMLINTIEDYLLPSKNIMRQVHTMSVPISLGFSAVALSF